MIKSISIKTYRGDSITLELTRPDLSGFIVRKIDGLTPAKATINTSDISTNDGGIFNSSRINTRNITLDLEFMRYHKPDGTYASIEEIRQLSYKYFPVKRNVTITIETDLRTVMTEGWIESNEPDIFSENEGSSISIICPDPFFYSISDNRTIFSGVEPMFEFEFSNDSLTEKELQMGEIYSKKESIVVYEGDMDIGLTMYIYATGQVRDLSIGNTRTEERLSIDTDKLPFITGVKEVAASSYGELDEEYVFDVLYSYSQEEKYIDYAIDKAAKDLALKQNGGTQNDAIEQRIHDTLEAHRYIFEGDTIIINTQVNNKNITLIRDGVAFNILNCVSKNSGWFTLLPGDNLFVYRALSGDDNLSFQVINKVAYYGV